MMWYVAVCDFYDSGGKKHKYFLFVVVRKIKKGFLSFSFCLLTSSSYSTGKKEKKMEETF